MISFLPIPGGHIKLAARFVDPALAFTMGWNYWYNWTIILPAELSAAAVLINLWNQTVSNGVWIAICLAVVVFINVLGAGAYGEAEFWFASIKGECILDFKCMLRRKQTRIWRILQSSRCLENLRSADESVLLVGWAVDDA